MFNLDKVYTILDEMVMNGCIVETSKTRILEPIKLMEQQRWRRVILDKWRWKITESLWEFLTAWSVFVNLNEWTITETRVGVGRGRPWHQPGLRGGCPPPRSGYIFHQAGKSTTLLAWLVGTILQRVCIAFHVPGMRSHNNPGQSFQGQNANVHTSAY